MPPSESRGLGSHLVATLGGSAHFFRFWLHFWSILAPFWLILAPFSNIFGCLLFAFFGGTSVFLGCWVIVFLGCLVAGLPDYWVVGWLFFGVVGLLGFWFVVLARRNARSDPPPHRRRRARYNSGSPWLWSSILWQFWDPCTPPLLFPPGTLHIPPGGPQKIGGASFVASKIAFKISIDFWRHFGF